MWKIGARASWWLVISASALHAQSPGPTLQQLDHTA
jgi:hypothetical protein